MKHWTWTWRFLSCALLSSYSRYLRKTLLKLKDTKDTRLSRYAHRELQGMTVFFDKTHQFSSLLPLKLHKLCPLHVNARIHLKGCCFRTTRMTEFNWKKDRSINNEKNMSRALDPWSLPILNQVVGLLWPKNMSKVLLSKVYLMSHFLDWKNNIASEWFQAGITFLPEHS